MCIGGDRIYLHGTASARVRVSLHFFFVWRTSLKNHQIVRLRSILSSVLHMLLLLALLAREIVPSSKQPLHTSMIRYHASHFFVSLCCFVPLEATGNLRSLSAFSQMFLGEIGARAFAGSFAFAGSPSCLLFSWAQWFLLFLFPFYSLPPPHSFPSTFLQHFSFHFKQSAGILLKIWGVILCCLFCCQRWGFYAGRRPLL